MKKRGSLFVVSSPSGGGKTTLGNIILKSLPALTRSISMTTRLPRNGERHGRDYFFTTAAEFLRLRKKKGFLESANVFGKLYGTPLAFVESKRRQGKDVLLLIDVQGAKQVKRHCGEAVLVFVMPPSLKELKTRLKKRSTDSPREILKRLKIAKQEIAQAKRYDYVVVNKNLKNAAAELKTIIRAERLRVK